MPWRNMGFIEWLRHIGPMIMLGTLQRRAEDPDAIPRWLTTGLKMLLPIAIGGVSAWTSLQVIMAHDADKIDALSDKMTTLATAIREHKMDSQREFTDLRTDVNNRISHLEDRVDAYTIRKR